MGLFGKKKDEIIKPVDLTYVDGIDNYTNGSLVNLSLDETSNCLVINTKKNNLPKVNLSFEKITAVEIIHEKDIIETNKNAIGRAVVGNVLLGPLGAIVGGMSGIGTKKSTKLKSFLVVNYRAENEIKVLSFEIANITLSLPKFINKLREKIVVEQTQEIYL